MSASEPTKPAEGLPDPLPSPSERNAALLTLATVLREHQFTNDVTYKGCSCGQLNNYGVISVARWTQWVEHVALLLAPLVSARVAAALREAADLVENAMVDEKHSRISHEAILALIPDGGAALDAVVAQAVRKARLDALDEADKLAMAYKTDALATSCGIAYEIRRLKEKP